MILKSHVVFSFPYFKLFFLRIRFAITVKLLNRSQFNLLLKFNFNHRFHGFKYHMYINQS